MPTVDGADRMKAQLDDLLRYSRVGIGAADPTVVYLDTLVVEVLRDLGPAWETPNRPDHGLT